MKDDLRRKFKEKRDSLSKNDVILKSVKIKDLLFIMDLFRKSKVVLFYVSYGNEVFTHDMIKECLLLDKVVVVPKSNVLDNTLILSRLKDWNDLELGAYNILEPKSINKIDISLIDLVIVPGVVFDKSGYRIGHGKGYYDRFLSSAKDIISIGLAYQFQVVDSICVDEFDQRLDYIITENDVLKFN